MRILVAGVGNVFLGDDGFGVSVANMLASMSLPEGVHVAEFGVRGVHLAYEMLNGYDLVLIVDAMPRGGPPGTLYVVEPNHIEASQSMMDSHGMNPEAVLAACRMLGGKIGKVVVVGCEPVDCAERLGLSDQVAAALDEAAELVCELVREAATVDLDVT